MSQGEVCRKWWGRRNRKPSPTGSASVRLMVSNEEARAGKEASSGFEQGRKEGRGQQPGLALCEPAVDGTKTMGGKGKSGHRWDGAGPGG